MIRNEIELDDTSHYLFVIWSIKAPVSLGVGPERMMRRVGGKGGADGGMANIDTLDFNVDAASKMDRVMVRWTSGVCEVLIDVQVDKIVSYRTLQGW